MPRASPRRSLNASLIPMNKADNEYSGRIQKESDFHDDLARNRGNDVNFYDVGANWHALKRLLDLVGDLRGKTVMEFGCGCGWICRPA